MPRNSDIYNYEKRLRNKLSQIKKSESLSRNNRRKILDFHRHCIAEGLSEARTLRYLHDLPLLAQYLEKDFGKATERDFERVLNRLEKTDYASQTKLDFKKTIKKFYKWLNGGEQYPESVRWIKAGRKRNDRKLPEELLTEEEVKKMIETASHPRDRAAISVLWESGCRVGEFLGLEVKHVVFEETVTRIIVHGKTGSRRIPIIDSTPYLAEWIENHPFKGEPDSPLWMGIGTVGRNKMLSYPAFRKMLAETAKRAHIKKKVNPHNFRHSRATFLARHLTEAQMNQYMGWVRGSDMPATYVHLSGRDMDSAILKLRGLEPKEEKTKSTMAPKECPRCGLKNKATGRFCIRCGSVLDLETAVSLQDEIRDMDEKFSKLLQDEKVQRVLIARMIELDIK
jgi:integrase